MNICPNKGMLIAAGMASISGATAAAQTRPNFVLILTDDQSCHLGMLGTPGIQTPNIDALVNHGVFFTKAYSAAASCSPCRGAILTGMYPHSNGHWRNAVAPELADADVEFSRASKIFDQVGVHEDLPTLIELLDQNGYITGITDKFHLSPPWKYPFTYRFPVGFSPQEHARVAMEFINKLDDRPFFLMANIRNTHRPYRLHIKHSGLPEVSPADVVIPPNWPDTEIMREDYAEYLSTVEHCDAIIGAILQSLEKTGKAGHTVIIYSSDQGFGYHRAKATMYDWGIHVPLSFTGPGIVSGVQNTVPVSHIDIVPTMLDFAGIRTPKTVQGLSLRGILSGASTELARNYVASEHNAHGPAPSEYYPIRTITDGRFRYIRNLRHEIVPDYPIDRFEMDEEFKKIPKMIPWLPWDCVPGEPWGNRAFGEIIKHKKQYPELHELLNSTFFRPEEELYDLENDPYEMHNLAGNPEHRETLRRMRNALSDWMHRTGDDGDPRKHPRRS